MAGGIAADGAVAAVAAVAASADVEPLEDLSGRSLSFPGVEDDMTGFSDAPQYMPFVCYAIKIDIDEKITSVGDMFLRASQIHHGFGQSPEASGKGCRSRVAITFVQSPQKTRERPGPGSGEGLSSFEKLS